MSDHDEITDHLDALERKIDVLDKTFLKCTSDMLEALRLQADMIAEMGEVISIIRSPSEESLARYATLREAFDRYDFVRRLALGQTTGDEK